MKKFVALFGVGICLGVVLFGWFSRSEAARSVADVTIFVTDFEYINTTIEINQGDTVRWENQSGTHNVASVSGPESFRNGDPVSGGWSYEFTFNTPGFYTYICEEPGHVALGMEGQIQVNPRIFYFLPLAVR